MIYKKTTTGSIWDGEGAGGQRDGERGGEWGRRGGASLLRAVSSRGNPGWERPLLALGLRLHSGKQLAPLSFINIKVSLK